MAGNFWKSSHYKQWLLEPTDLIRERHEDLKLLTEEEYSKAFIFFSSFIHNLGEQLKLRQQVIATAVVYFRRFYYKHSITSVDPLLLAPTSIFLASKVEEFGVISTTRLVQTCVALLKTKFQRIFQQDFPYKAAQILECEFFLMEAMDCCLVVYQPYRALSHLMVDLPQPLATELMPVAWRTVNDSLWTDVPLLYIPSHIALAAIFMASVVLAKDLHQWFASLSVDMNKVHEIMQTMMATYKMLKNYDEVTEVKAILAKIGKPKTSAH